MAQNGIVPTDLPSFPFESGDKLYAVPVNNQFFAMLNLLNNLQNQVTLLQSKQVQALSYTTDWGGGNTVTAGPYTVTSSAPSDFIITSIDVSVGTGGGSFQVSVVNNGAVVGNAQQVVVSSPNKLSLVVTGQNTTVKRGNTVQLVIFNVVGTPTNAFVTINGVTQQDPFPSVGIGTGQANGTSNCVASSVFTVGTQMVGFASGTATAIAGSRTAFMGTGTASGTATATSIAVSFVPGAAVGFAFGTAVATGVGATSNPDEHIFVLDDPQYGRLDINPIA